jgi:hypothetical protein
MKKNGNTLVIACGSIQPELELLRKEAPDSNVVYMDQNLHRTPDKMKAVLQEAITRETETAERIVLGYGLCANGVVGIKAPKQGLYIPKAHDCIALFMGSREAYNDAFKKRPGTYYLTQSWIENKKDPLGLMENEYTERVGAEDAEWSIKQELKNYSHIAFINTGVGDSKKNRNRAKENAQFLNLEYIEIDASKSFLMKILKGPYDNENFLFFKPGQTVTQGKFLK